MMATFPILRRKDKERFGECRTKRLIVGYYDAYAASDLSLWLGREENREADIHPNNPPRSESHALG